MGKPVNQKCVQRLTQKIGLRALIQAKKRSLRVPGVSDAPVPNVLQRNLCATAPNQKWATDVTEFNVDGNKLYLSACTLFGNLSKANWRPHQSGSMRELLYWPSRIGVGARCN